MNTVVNAQDGKRLLLHAADHVSVPEELIRKARCSISINVYGYVTGTCMDTTAGDGDGDVYVDGTERKAVDGDGTFTWTERIEQIKQTRTLPFVNTTAEGCIKHPKRRERKRPLGH